MALHLLSDGRKRFVSGAKKKQKKTTHKTPQHKPENSLKIFFKTKEKKRKKGKPVYKTQYIVDLP